MQKSARANPMVVYIDKVKGCMAETPTSWLCVDSYNVIPPMLEPEVLTKMFGNTDRGGILTSADDVDTTLIERPKRNAGVPARFLSRVYAEYCNGPSNVYVNIKTEYVDNDSFCLFRFSNMRKMAKKTYFEYRCFPCPKQDDKVRSYTRSYDLILHMVNTHRKFPVDAKHNAYYAADGSDLRDATGEEIEKYRQAAAHKHRKPDAESSCEKSESATMTHPGRKVDTTHLRKEEDRGRRGYFPHNRGSGHRPTSHDQESKGGRTLSRDLRSHDSRRGREAATRSSSKTKSSRHQGTGDAGGVPLTKKRRRGIMRK